MSQEILLTVGTVFSIIFLIVLCFGIDKTTEDL